jgi:hypothetical protein
MALSKKLPLSVFQDLPTSRGKRGANKDEHILNSANSQGEQFLEHSLSDLVRKEDTQDTSNHCPDRGYLLYSSLPSTKREPVKRDMEALLSFQASV